jgi:centromeric protein E
MTSAPSTMTDKIRVAIRVRPLNQREQTAGSVWMIEENRITQCTITGRPIPSASYVFDNIFEGKQPSHSVYEATASDIIQSAMDGVNGTIFAYGQTSSGKTFTMRGTKELPGIIPMSVKDVFNYIEAHPEREFALRVSFMEIYNEGKLLDSFDLFFHSA